MQLTKYGKAVCDWAILPKHMQSKLDFTKSIFRSVSNNKIQDSKNFYWQIMKQELNKMTKVKKGLEMKYRDIPKNQYINTKLQ